MFCKKDWENLKEYEKNPQAYNGPAPRAIPDVIRNYYDREEARRKGLKLSSQVASKAADNELFLYDIIGKDFFGGISAGDVADMLSKMEDAKQIHVRINSDGGAVSDGMAIHAQLTQHPADITVSVDGFAASIASVIAMAGDTIQVTPQSMLMIHDPWAMVAGNAADMRAQADILDKVAGQIAETYSTRTGVKLNKVREMMAAETWMTGGEAVDMKFADKLVDAKTPKQQLEEQIYAKLLKGRKVA